MVTGWHGKVIGDAVVRSVVGDDSGRVITTVPGGFHHSDYDAFFAYVFAATESEWTPEAPWEDVPMPSQFTSVTWLDRTSFAVLGTRTFDPPLEMPYPIGGGLIVDTPRRGTSDIARDVRIASYDVASGERVSLHDGRAFALFSCSRENAVTVAYRPGALAKTVVVDIAFDDASHAARASQIEIEDLAPTNVLCRAHGTHAAIVGTSADRSPRIVVVEHRADTLAITQEVAASEPAALSTDGKTLLATGPKAQAALFTAKKVVQLRDVTVTGTASVSGDRALVNNADGGWIVRLDGSSPPAMRVDRASKVEGSRSGFAVGDGMFLFFDEAAYDYVTDKESIAQAFVVDPKGRAIDVAIDPSFSRPSVVWADGKRAYVMADRDKDHTEIVTIDLETREVVATQSSMLCDRPTMREKNRCLP